MSRKGQLQWSLSDIAGDLRLPALSMSAQGFVYQCGEHHVIKVRQNVDLVRRELEFIEAAGDCAVEVLGSVSGPDGWSGFIMPSLQTIDAHSLNPQEKKEIFHQILHITLTLHDKGIIHGDIKLSNMLLDKAGNVKICDFGAAAFAPVTHYPIAVTTRWCSRYRFLSPSQPLIAAEDIYALGTTVWEIFTGLVPYHDLQDDEVEDAIMSGKLPHLGFIENEEVRHFIEQCWDIFHNKHRRSLPINVIKQTFIPAQLYLEGSDQLCFDEGTLSLDPKENVSPVKRRSTSVTKNNTHTICKATVMASHENEVPQDNLNNSIAEMDATLGLAPLNNSDRVQLLQTLSKTLQARFEQMGQMGDLTRAIVVEREVLRIFREKTLGIRKETLGTDHPATHWSIQRLASSYYDLGLMNEAAELYRAALETQKRVLGLTPHDILQSLEGLASSYYCLSQVSEAANLRQKAMEIRKTMLGQKNPDTALDMGEVRLSFRDLATDSRVNDSPEELACLDRLSSLLYRRFYWTCSKADLDEAIAINGQVVNSTPEDQPCSSWRLSNLAVCFQARFELTGCVADLENSITLLKRAVSLTQLDDRHRSIYLGNFGNALLRRFEKVSFQRYTQNLHPLPKRAAVMKVGELECLAHTQTALSDLNNAIKVTQEAIDSNPADTGDRLWALNRLAVCLQYRFEISGSSEDVKRAIETYEFSLGLSSGPTTARIIAAYRAGLGLYSIDVLRASHLTKTAIEMFPLASPHALNANDDWHSGLSEFHELASTAASFVLQSSGSIVEALQLLELGRGILLSISFNTVNDLVNLRKMHPELADRFIILRDEMDSSNSDNIYADWECFEPKKPANELRNVVATDFNLTLKRIRALDGFRNFLRCPVESELKALAIHSPIVVFNVTPFRSDAFLVTHEHIGCIKLPRFHYADVQSKAKSLAKHLEGLCSSKDGAANAFLNDMLGWLWDAAVGPAIEALGFHSAPQHGDPLPCVRWVANGWLSLLPIHAAGYHNSDRNALDRVISSFIPSLKFLSSASSAPETPKRPFKALFVKMIETPSEPHLLHADEEIHRITSILGNTSLLPSPTKAEVLSELNNSDIVHFVCHGIDTVNDVSKCRLLLSDWKKDPLSMTDFIALRRERVQLVYLSACHFPQGIESLSDGHMHFSVSCNAAGFSQAIGTLWHFDSESSARVAQVVYEAIKGHDDCFGIENAAQGLHSAVTMLRKQMPTDPLLWARYIHSGV